MTAGVFALSAMALCAIGWPVAAQLLPEEPANAEALDSLDPALQPVNSTQALKTSEQSVVRVLVVYRGYGGVPLDAVGMGSGFVVAPGYIVTNYHVIETPPEATSAEIYIVPHKDSGAAYQQVTLARPWMEGDLALLRAEGLKIAPLKLSLVPQKNQQVVAMGYPGITDRLLKRGGTELLEPADAYVTQGSIALFASTNPDGSRVDTLFHTAPINPGNSGGPLMDECGQVVGVNTWSAVSTMSEGGDMDVPAGQYVATHVSALNTFLQSAGVPVQTTSDPCYAKTADEIVKDEGLSKALAAYRDAQAKRIEEQRKAEQLNAVMDQLQLGALVLLSLLVVVLIALIIRRRPHKEKDAPTAYSAPTADDLPPPALSIPNPRARAKTPEPVEKKPHAKHPFPWGWIALGTVVVLIALGFVLRESPMFQTMSQKAEASAVSPAIMRLSCDVDLKASPKPLPGVGPIDFEFDAAHACVSGRTPYEVQPNGTLLRFTVSDAEPVAARLELSRDGLVFKRSDYRLSDDAHRSYVAQRQALGSLRCVSGKDTGQAEALKDNLRKVRTLAQSFLTAGPETETVWKCRKAPEKAQ
ncbi:serine protease [Asticcacaulis sp. BYS171W]|uniref:Serine protease n=1 Tax=Asticcacaulis aquaticus TaxID=2984212 RepID=A0ABT5HRZ0_9CAUL|nr:serine protease [Asticcacaulis aquaticus]